MAELPGKAPKRVSVEQRDEAEVCMARLLKQADVITTDAGGCHIVWRRFGNGPDTMLIHGGHGSWLHWVRNIEALAAHRTVWVPDLPGFGESGDPPGGEWQALLDATIAGFAQLQTSGVVDLVGFSFGGYTASQLAGTMPGVRSLALLGPGGHGGVRRQTRALIDWRQAPDANALADVMRHNVEAFMIADAEKVDALALLAYTVSCQKTRFRSKRISRSGGLGDALDRFAGPVLIAYGENDVTADPQAVIASLVEGKPAAGSASARKGVVIGGAGHWVQYEADDSINALLLDWLTSVDAGG